MAIYILRTAGDTNWGVSDKKSQGGPRKDTHIKILGNYLTALKNKKK